MKYTDFYKHLNEDDSEGKDWVRPGSDLDSGMTPGETNFPHGWGYPNYKPKVNDVEDFEETCSLNTIIDVPDEHYHEDEEKRKNVILKYIKTKLSDFYKKYEKEINNSFESYNMNDIIYWLTSDIESAIENPSHQNVKHSANQEDLDTLHKIQDLNHKLYSLIHHRNDPQNELNYPLHVSLYDITRAFGGYEEGGWWYDNWTLIKSIEVKSPREVVPTAEKLYNETDSLDGKPYIVIEKQKGSREKEKPEYS